MLAQRDQETTILMRDSQCAVLKAPWPRLLRGDSCGQLAYCACALPAFTPFLETCETGNDIRQQCNRITDSRERCAVRFDIATVRSSRRPCLLLLHARSPARSAAVPDTELSLHLTRTGTGCLVGVPSLTEHLVHPYPRAPPLVYCVHAPPRNEAAL